MLVKCKQHPTYKMIREPRSTTKYPKGCPRCWELFRLKNKCTAPIG